MVYELESRVHDLESAQDNGAMQPRGSPALRRRVSRAQLRPAAGSGRIRQPGRARRLTSGRTDSQPGRSQPEQQSNPRPDPGSSRREDLRPKPPPFAVAATIALAIA